MRRLFLCAFALALLIPASSFAAQISGDYVETRSADVYTGPCFANGETGLIGKEATIAWRVRQGEWNGTRLDGLSVVAVVRANATLGDPYHDPSPARSVIIVDQNATDAQKQALVAFAQSMAGRLLDDIVLVQSAPISMQVGDGEHHGSVMMKAGDVAMVQTRSLSDRDHYCGNEETYYPPLTQLSHAMPAFAIANTYAGNSLGKEWRIFDKRSAFVGTFMR